jgi:hypothetical protein
MIPPDRQRQFDLIEIASLATIEWARKNGKTLEHISPVVPFVETDFSLGAWLFVDTDSRVEEYLNDGTAGSIESEFRAALSKANYPTDWLKEVKCYFASKETVDRDYKGSYFYFTK